MLQRKWSLHKKKRSFRPNLICVIVTFIHFNVNLGITWSAFLKEKVLGHYEVTYDKAQRYLTEDCSTMAGDEFDFPEITGDSKPSLYREQTCWGLCISLNRIDLMRDSKRQVLHKLIRHRRPRDPWQVFDEDYSSSCQSAPFLRNVFINDVVL